MAGEFYRLCLLLAIGFVGTRANYLVVGLPAGEAAFFGGELEGVFAVELGLVHEFFDAVGQGLHWVGGGECIGRVLGGNKERDFAFGGAVFKRGREIGERAAAEFFVQLGNFAREAGVAVAEDFAGVREAFGDTMRSLVENDSAVLEAKAFKGPPAFAGAVREEADEEKLFVGQAGSGERGQNCRGSGNGNDRNVMAQAKSD